MPENNSQPEQVSTLAQFWASVNYPVNAEDPLQRQQDESDRLSMTPLYQERFKAFLEKSRRERLAREAREKGGGGPAVGGLLPDANPLGPPQ